jgi:hypothetical protein
MDLIKMKPTDPNFVPAPNGGAAFPITHSWRNDNAGGFKGAGAPGMTLLDYFAGQVATALLQHDPEVEDEIIAEQAYDLAQAMVAEKIRRIAPRHQE